MALLDLDNILKKGLQSELATKSIDPTCLSFTTDTKRLYIEDGTNRIQITDVIFGMTETQIINNANLLPKFYVASDTLKIYVSDGTSLEKVSYVPTVISGTDQQTYYPVMKSSGGTNISGYTSDLSYTPSTKEFNVGDVRISQTTDSSNNITVDFYIDNPSSQS